MKHRLAFLPAGVVVVVFGEAAVAHHAFSPVYDADQTVSITGTVTEFRFVNPHATMTIETADADGSTEAWTVEFDGKLNLTVGGWTERTIPVGETITVDGNPTHSGSPRMFFTRLVRSDGSVLVRPLLERGNAIDELRRERARQRDRENQ